jgi:hypothetical protein
MKRLIDISTFFCAFRMPLYSLPVAKNKTCSFDVPVLLDAFNVGSFLLCYDIVHKSILHICFSGMC